MKYLTLALMAAMMFVTPAEAKTKKKTYRPNVIEQTFNGVISGLASFYWEPQRIACGGGRFNPNAMTAAHKSLPCGTKVKVTNKRNGKSVVVTINDRGPYIKGRVIDLSRAAASQIGMIGSGVAPVLVTKL